MDLRTPKGTIDFSPKDTSILYSIISKSTQVFKLHNGVSIDTPTFELKSLLTNKYGDDSKLIFDLADQGGDICSLRYDFTVSFARYLAQYKIMKLKRYQVGKVFRRDQPILSKGKMREFWQCDFDIAGCYSCMTADAEIIKIAVECLFANKINEFIIKISHRQLLTAIFEMAGVEKDLHNTVCSTIDKTEKLSQLELRQEFLMKGLTEEQIVFIFKYTSKKGNFDSLKQLKNNKIYENVHGKVAIDELFLLFEYLEIFKLEKLIEFDLSLARGTDYYTGLIFEAIIPGSHLGAILGGGRYDNLVSDFTNNKHTIPCVGFSIGVMRIFAVLKERKFENKVKFVYVVSSGKALLKERMTLVNFLWENGIVAETAYYEWNFKKQAGLAQKANATALIIIGETELEKGIVCVSIDGIKSEVKQNLLVDYIKSHVLKS